VAVRSPSVRQLVMLYSEATGQKMPLSASTPYAGSLVEQGANLYQERDPTPLGKSVGLLQLLGLHQVSSLSPRDQSPCAGQLQLQQIATSSLLWQAAPNYGLHHHDDG